MQLFNWKKFLLYAYYRLEKSARLLENIVHDYYIGWKEIYIRRRYNNLIKTKRNKNENILKIFLRVFFYDIASQFVEMQKYRISCGKFDSTWKPMDKSAGKNWN